MINHEGWATSHNLHIMRKFGRLTWRMYRDLKNEFNVIDVEDFQTPRI